MLFRHALLQELISTVAAFLILVGMVIATTSGFNMIRFLPMLLSPSLPTTTLSALDSQAGHSANFALALVTHIPFNNLASIIQARISQGEIT